MRALAKTVVCLGVAVGALAFGAAPAQAQIFGRRVVVVNPPYVVPGQVVSTPMPTTYVAPAVAPAFVPSGVVPAGYNATTVVAPVPTVMAPTVMAPMRTVYPTRYVVGPFGRVRRVYSNYYYPAY
jgi:hypothetical protein